jgi:hypothetical protein
MHIIMSELLIVRSITRCATSFSQNIEKQIFWSKGKERSFKKYFHSIETPGSNPAVLGKHRNAVLLINVLT